jgi:DNA-binding IclR family transcriptional regulator
MYGSKTSTADSTRSFPGVRRVIAILDFFADHSNQSFTLADLIRALKLRRSTCHALLGGLLESGYLYRTRDKSYVIGPRLLAAGRIAKEQFSILQIAEPEMRELADDYDAICSAIFRESDAIVVRARAASVSQLGMSIPAGTRIPLRPPFAALHFAWSPSEELAAWLDRVQPPAEPAQRDQMMAAMEFAREQGFVFGRRTAPPARESPERVFQGPAQTYPVTAEASLDSRTRYELAYVLAPVFDVRGQIAFIMGFTQMTGSYLGSHVEKMGRQLREACGRTSTFARLSNLT